MERWELVLYIAGVSARTERATENLRRACDATLPGGYELTVVDVLEQPDLAEAEKVLATPTLIKRSPAPQRRITGDFSDADRVLSALGVIQAD